MTELREALTTFLETIHPRVYFERAPSSAEFSYLVFVFQLYPDGEGFELCTLSIDGWDKSPDTTALETLMAQVKTLDKKTIINNDSAITFYLENVIPLSDDDERIRRRNYNFSGRLIRKG